MCRSWCAIRSGSCSNDKTMMKEGAELASSFFSERREKTGEGGYQAEHSHGAEPSRNATQRHATGSLLGIGYRLANGFSSALRP